MITVVNSGTYSKALDKSTAEFDFDDVDLDKVNEVDD
jgi:hypothetical protein